MSNAQPSILVFALALFGYSFLYHSSTGISSVALFNLCLVVLVYIIPCVSVFIRLHEVYF